MINKTKWFTFFFFSLVLYRTEDSFADYNDVRGILKAKGCNGCHNNGSEPPATYDSSAWPGVGTKSYFGSVITPGKATDSILFNRINKAVGTGGFMPQGGSKLSSSDIGVIEAWINSLTSKTAAAVTKVTKNEYALKDANELTASLNDAFGDNPAIYNNGYSCYSWKDQAKALFFLGARHYFLGRYADLGGTCDPNNGALAWREEERQSGDQSSINYRMMSNGNHVGLGRTEAYNSCERYSSGNSVAEFDESASKNGIAALPVASRYTLIVRACEGFFLETNYKQFGLNSLTKNTPARTYENWDMSYIAMADIRIAQVARRVRGLASPPVFNAYPGISWGNATAGNSNNTYQNGSGGSSSSSVTASGSASQASCSYSSAKKTVSNLDLSITAVTKDDIKYAYRAFHPGESPSGAIIDALEKVARKGEAGFSDTTEKARYGWRALMITLCMMPSWQVK